MIDLSFLGENIRMARVYRNITQDELCRKCKYHRSSLSRLENNDLDITFQSIVKLAKALDINIIELFSRNFKDQKLSSYIEDDFLLVFCENVNKILAKKNKYQESLFPKTGLFPATISEILNQKVNPKISSMQKIATALETTISDLLVRNGGQ